MKTARERFKKFIEDFYLVLVLVFLYAPPHWDLDFELLKDRTIMTRIGAYKKISTSTR